MDCKSRAVSLVGCALFMAAVACNALAQEYPNRLVKLVIPFPPGGTAESQTRVIAQKLSQIWGQPVIVENKPGAGTTIGAAYVAKSPADGYTLYSAWIQSHAISWNLYKNLPYDAVKSFATVSQVTSVPYLAVTYPEYRANTLGELIELAKAKPGALSYASTGAGVGPHLASEILCTLAGAKVVHVPFKGAGPAMVALLGKQVDYGFMDASVLANVQAGKLKALAVTSGRRWSKLPTVPTVAESGFPGFDAVSESMILAPAGTPKDIVAKVNATLRAVMAAPDVQKLFATQGVDTVVSSPEELEARLAAEVVKYGRAIKELGLSAD